MNDVILEHESKLIVDYPTVVLEPTTHIYNGHALIESKISIMRDVSTPSSIFRKLVEEVTKLIAFDAFSHLKMESKEIITPICPTIGKRIAGKKQVLVPILRAGLAMEQPMKDIVPQARTGFCGIYRDEETLKPQKYFWKMPKDIENREVFVLDPMLATGGSADFTVSELKKIGCKTIHFMGIIGAPQGIDLMQKKHPDVELFIAHLDKGLNSNGYIVPGLGDAGDRIFGTK
ncbi:uracil phosphoribosyltransferase [Candidatus Saccharibacteria bacterium]|nr:uracil phosphoribosyltransferase [Candidatus Saccharibacteria bacterium]